MSHSPRHLLAPVIGFGVLTAIYLLARPYGDAGSPAQTAEAWASGRWVLAHVAGLLGLASVARLALRLSDLQPGAGARLARWSGMLGLVLVLPYYGAETFGLHAVGLRALGEPEVLTIAEQIRYQPVALAMFGIGLLLLSTSGIAAATALRALDLAPRWSAWAFGAVIALFPVQYFVAPAGRLGYAVVAAAAAAVLAVAIAGSEARDRGAAAARLAREQPSAA